VPRTPLGATEDSLGKLTESKMEAVRPEAQKALKALDAGAEAKE
jgi:hypothetical protein